MLERNWIKRTFFLLFLCMYTWSAHAVKIGLLIVATGNYIQFVAPLIDSANRYFCTQHQVTYFVFTDGESPKGKNIVTIEQQRLGWPEDTLMRPFMYHQHRDKLTEMDYLFAIDADMRFVDVVGDEILSHRVATQHPGYVGRRGTYETRKRSKAYVHRDEGKQYFAGGFNGGLMQEFLKMVQTIAHGVERDKKSGLIAVWHDESHLNRYFINNPPTKILSPSYCYPENWKIPYQKRLLALDKNHAEIRK